MSRCGHPRLSRARVHLGERRAPEGATSLHSCQTTAPDSRLPGLPPWAAPPCTPHSPLCLLHFCFGVMVPHRPQTRPQPKLSLYLPSIRPCPSMYLSSVCLPVIVGHCSCTATCLARTLSSLYPRPVGAHLFPSTDPGMLRNMVDRHWDRVTAARCAGPLRVFTTAQGPRAADPRVPAAPRLPLLSLHQTRQSGPLPSAVPTPASSARPRNRTEAPQARRWQEDAETGSGPGEVGAQLKKAKTMGCLVARGPSRGTLGLTAQKPCLVCGDLLPPWGHAARTTRPIPRPPCQVQPHGGVCSPFQSQLPQLPPCRREQGSPGL